MRLCKLVKKFDKIYRKDYSKTNSFEPDELVYVEEKIDGANFRVWVDENDELRFGSRTMEFLPELDDKVGYGAFTEAVEYIKTLNKDKFKYGLIYYFEAMIKHSLHYDYDKHPKAFLFDIYRIQDETYYEVAIVKLAAELIGCEKTITIFNGHYKDFNQKIPISKYGNFQAEGFVIKPIVSSRDVHGNIHRAKVVGGKFKEQHRETFGDANDKESAFAIRYATFGRIDKEIHKLETIKNEKIKPEWIGFLTYNITKDICDEEFKKLLKMKQPNLQTIQKEVRRQLKLRLTQLKVI